MKDNVVFEPCSQTQYDILVDDTPMLFLSSGRGTGKSTLLAIKALSKCLTINNFSVLVLRRSYPELTDLIRTFQFYVELVASGQYTYNGSKHRFVFKENGSTITFAYLLDQKSVNNLQGFNVDLLMVDEITNFPDCDLLSQVFAVVRTTKPGVIPQIILGGNPSGVGFKFFKKNFISVAPFEKVYRAFGRDSKTYHLRIEDNYHIIKSNPEYLEQLEALPSHLRAAWRDGSWEYSLSDKYFGSFDPQVHTIDNFIPDSSYEIFRSHDWGSSAPAVTLFIAEAENSLLLPNGVYIPKGSFIVFDEIYEAQSNNKKKGLKLTTRELARNILSREEELGIRGRVNPGGADSAIWSNLGTDSTIADVYENAAVPFIPCKKGPNSRVNGWNNIKNLLKNGIMKPIENPCLFICKKCKDLIRELDEAQYDIKKQEDLDTTGSDHALDALSYGLSTDRGCVISMNRGY